DGAHGANLEIGAFKLLPLSALGFATAGQHGRALQGSSLAGPGGLAVIRHSRFERAKKNLIRSRVADSAGDRPSVLHHGNGDAELGNASDEFARAVERIDHPDPALFQARVVIDAFF